MRLTGAKVYDVQEGFVSRDVCIDGELIGEGSTDGKTADLSGYLSDPRPHGCTLSRCEGP